MGIRAGGNVKKCRPVVKEPSGGTLLFRCALPARGASAAHDAAARQTALCLGAACTGCIIILSFACPLIDRLCLGAACTGCIFVLPPPAAPPYTLPRRCLHGVHRPARCGNRHRPGFASALPARGASTVRPEINNKVVLCLGAACTGCILVVSRPLCSRATLPRRCLHGVHPPGILPGNPPQGLCLGAACTGCIGKSRQIAAHLFVAYAVSR